MATAEISNTSQGLSCPLCKDPALTATDKSGRSKLLTWMRKLTKPKGVSKKVGASGQGQNGPQSHARQQDADDKHAATSCAQNEPGGNRSFNSLSSNPDGSHRLDGGDRSIAPTLATNAGTINSDAAASEADRNSKTGTTHTFTGGLSTKSVGGGNSIFSSSNHSSRSLTTTLTTIQSAPSLSQHTHRAANAQDASDSQDMSQPAHSPTYFSHQYPIQPASAVPPYLTPHTHVPTTYRSATANNLLTDNASVITLASSSGRPNRRNSLDTNASIRAIAPSSVWGGSRESLPLSVLSQSADATYTGPTPPSTAGLSSTARSSTIATGDRQGYTSGVGVSAPALSSERNSIYAGSKTPQADVASLHDRASLRASSIHGEKYDAASTKSGIPGHGRTSSFAGSIGGISSPLAVSKDNEPSHQ